MARPKPKVSESRIESLLEIAQLAASGLPLNSEQAAGYLQLRPATLAVWRCAGRGPRFVLVGTSPRYLKSDLDQWISNCKTQRRVSPNVGRPAGRGKPRRRTVRG
jgi:hypothetical protein